MVHGIGSPAWGMSTTNVIFGFSVLYTLTQNFFFGNSYVPSFPLAPKLTPHCSPRTQEIVQELFERVHGTCPQAELPIDFLVEPEPSCVAFEPPPVEMICEELPLEGPPEGSGQPAMHQPFTELASNAFFDGLKALLSGNPVFSSSTLTTLKDVGGIAFGFAALSLLYYMSRTDTTTDYCHFKAATFREPSPESNPLSGLKLALAKNKKRETFATMMKIE